LLQRRVSFASIALRETELYLVLTIVSGEKNNGVKKSAYHHERKPYTEAVHNLAASEIHILH
jgi:hypothetical protein